MSSRTRLSSSLLSTRRRALIESLETRQMLSLTVDLRLPGGGKAATVTGVGQVINLEIWATARGANTSVSDEALQIAVGSLLSSNINGGAAGGTLKASTHFNFSSFGSSAGVQRDLDGDGDLDVGSNNTTDGSSFFAARAGGMNSGTASGSSKVFRIGSATFTVTSLKSTSGQTNLTFRTRNSGGTGAVWEEDGKLKREVDGTYNSGSPVVLRRSGSTSGGSIAGNVFRDTDKDNVKDSGESGFSGVTMYLDKDKDGVRDSGEPSTATDASGNYVFGGLAAGSYRVRQVVPGGWTIGSPSSGYHDLSLTTGQNVSGRNFADRSTTTTGNTGRISGILFSDADRDGVLDSGDTRLSNRRMYIDSNRNGRLDSGERTSTTSGSGEFVFSSLAAGSYRIRRADLPTGYTYSSPASGYHEVTLTSGQQVSGKNFGAIPISGGGGGSATISGIVFNDGDKDGSVDSGESRLSNRRIYVDANRDGRYNTGEKSVLSNSSGAYSFSNLAAGTYRIRRADLPSGYKYSTPSAGYHEVTVSGTQVVSGRNFGAIPSTGTVGTGGSATISGIVFNDGDRDAQLDSSDTRLSNRRIYVDANRDGRYNTGEKSVLSNSSGAYSFSNLAAGTYRIRRADLPSGYKYSTPSAGYHEVTVSGTQVVSGRNFGAILATASVSTGTSGTNTGRIAGVVFDDLDKDGRLDAADKRLAGRRMYVDANRNGKHDSGERSTLTNGGGEYSFSNLPSGNYRIRRADVPSSYTYTLPSSGYYDILLGSGETEADRHFGFKAR